MPLFYEDYEELPIGHTWTTVERLISQKDVDNFASVTGDTNPVHVDIPYANKSSFGGPTGLPLGSVSCSNAASNTSPL